MYPLTLSAAAGLAALFPLGRAGPDVVRDLLLVQDFQLGERCDQVVGVLAARPHGVPLHLDGVQLDKRLQVLEGADVLEKEKEKETMMAMQTGDQKEF